MVAARDFSGLTSSACALARAPAMVPIDSLDRCMARLHTQKVESDRASLRALGPDAMANRLFGVFGHKGPELSPGGFVLEKSWPGAAEGSRKFRPRIGRAHVDNANRVPPRPWSLHPEQARGFAILDAAPEFL